MSLFQPERYESERVRNIEKWTSKESRWESLMTTLILWLIVFAFVAAVVWAMFQALEVSA